MLPAFGLDSVIELISAGVLIWRLTVELRRGAAFSEVAEQTAGRIGGVLLLAAYVVVSAGWSLWHRHGATFSRPGLVLCVLAIPVMRYLANRRLAVAERPGSRAMRADGMESITCFWLSVVVMSLAAQALVGGWWIDAAGSLAIVWLLLKEGREAWNNEACGC